MLLRLLQPPQKTRMTMSMSRRMIGRRWYF
jgi:hypothetical protein